MGRAMSAATFRLYHVDFKTNTGAAVIRHPGRLVCAEILQINPEQLAFIRANARGGAIPAELIAQLSAGGRYE
jgi:hypothetical protein